MLFRSAFGAVDQLFGEGPAERGFGVSGDLRGVGEAVQARAGGGAILLVLRVAVEDGSHLLAGDVGVRRERRGAGAVDDTVVGGPGDGVLIVAVQLDIREAAAAGDSGLALETIEDCDEHGAGHGSVRAERRVAGAGEQAVLIGVDDIVIEPVGFAHILEGLLILFSIRFRNLRLRYLPHLFRLLTD